MYDVRKFQHVWTCLNRFSLWDFFPLAHLGFFLIWYLKRIGWWDMLEHPAHEQNSSHEGKPLECGWSEIGREGKQGKQNPNDMDGSWSRLQFVSTGFSLTCFSNVYFFFASSHFVLFVSPQSWWGIPFFCSCSRSRKQLNFELKFGIKVAKRIVCVRHCTNACSLKQVF